MEIYHFAQTSPIAKAEFSQDANKQWTARIFPQIGMPAESLSELTSTLNQLRDGIIAVPQSEKGVHTLYASGFESPSTLLNQLEKPGYTKGEARLEKTSQESDAFTARIRDTSLKWSGIFYIISDASMAGSGIMSGRYKETVAGSLQILIGGILARYGHKSPHKRLQDLSLSLGDFFTQNNIPIPKDSAIDGANQERLPGIVEGLERFAYTYPSQLFNAVIAYCGVQLMQSGVTHKKNWDTLAGALVLGGALAGLLIPEKSETAKLPRPGEKEKKAKPEGMMGRIVDWAREKPLRIPGILWFGNNMAFLVSALKERKKEPSQKSYMFKLGYVAAATIANGLMFISSKDNSKHMDVDSDHMQALYAVAASVIASQPKDVQDQIIENTAGYLASQPGMLAPAREIAYDLREQVKELVKNPFLAHAPETPVVRVDQAHANPALKKPLPHPSPADWKTAVTPTGKEADSLSLT